MDNPCPHNIECYLLIIVQQNCRWNRHTTVICLLWVSWYFPYSERPNPSDQCVCCYPQNKTWRLTMMTSSNENIFHVTGPLWRESTGHRWIPLTKGSDAELWCFFICTWTNGVANNRGTGVLRHHCAHYDVTVMIEQNTKMVILARIKLCGSHYVSLPKNQYHIMSLSTLLKWFFIRLIWVYPC